MKKKKWNRVLAVLLMMVMSISLLSGCGSKSAEKEDAETITVYRKDHMNKGNKYGQKTKNLDCR